MRIFLTLCSLAVVVFARPQGYQYGTGISGVFTGSSSNIHGGSTGILTPPVIGHAGHTGHLNRGFTSYTGPSNVHQTTTHFGGIAPGFGYNTGFQRDIYSSSSGSSLQSINPNFPLASSIRSNSNGFIQQTTQVEPPLVHKQFFTIAAQEDHDSLEQSKHLVIGRPQKNYRVVFIKAPSSSDANVKLSAEYAPKEEKTVIYVLTKKDSTLEVNDIATPAPTVPSKPDVYFIKYKTEAEAQHAQLQIQAEYDKIQGSSEHNDGGVVQPQSVVGILDGTSSVGGSVGTTIVHTGDSGSTITTGESIGTVGTIGTIGSVDTITTSIDSSIGSIDFHDVAKGTQYLPPSKK